MSSEGLIVARIYNLDGLSFERFELLNVLNDLNVWNYFNNSKMLIGWN